METKWIDVKDDMPLKKLLELVSSGMEVVLTEDKFPVARLVSVPRKVNVRRVSGINTGIIWISPDFDEPLPDSFWFGEDTVA